MAIACLPQPADVVVAKVRLHAADRDAVSARSRVEALLRVVPPQAHGHSQSALLCVRHLAVHRSSTAQPRQRCNMSEDALALARRLGEVAASAQRPALEPISDGAAAVLFADRAELLACLVRDWLAGSAGRRWWWRVLFGGHDLGHALWEACMRSPDFVPAMLDRLAHGGDASRWVCSLSADALHPLHAAVAAAHGLARVLVAVGPASAGDVGPAQFDARTVDADAEGTHRRQALSAARSTPAALRWRATAPAPTGSGLAAPQTPALVSRHIPEAMSPNLLPAQRALLTLALGLARAPIELRASAGVVALWLGSEVPRAPPPTASASAPAFPVNAAAPQPVRVDAVSDPQQMQRPQAGPANGTPTAWFDGCGAPDGVASACTQVDAIASAVHKLGPPVRPAPGSGSSTLVTPQVVLPVFAAAPAFDRGTADTKFGGLLHLINVAVALDLYADFTRPAEPGIALPLWDFLALAGDYLIGAPLRCDPLWPLLAGLSGRSADEPPGLHFTPPAEWCPPASWLRPFTNIRGAWRWWTGPARLQVMHPAGFMLVDLPRDPGDPRRQLSRAMRPYRKTCRFRLAAGSSAVAPEPFDAMARWCGWLMPFLRAHVAIALRHQPPDAAFSLLVDQPARLVLSAARLDVHLSLDHLPIQVRLAGLDRNPGWVPAGGRSIAFHYD